MDQEQYDFDFPDFLDPSILSTSTADLGTLETIAGTGGDPSPLFMHMFYDGSFACDLATQEQANFVQVPFELHNPAAPLEDERTRSPLSFPLPTTCSPTFSHALEQSPLAALDQCNTYPREDGIQRKRKAIATVRDIISTPITSLLNPSVLLAIAGTRKRGRKTEGAKEEDIVPCHVRNLKAQNVLYAPAREALRHRLATPPELDQVSPCLFAHKRYDKKLGITICGLHGYPAGPAHPCLCLKAETNSTSGTKMSMQVYAAIDGLAGGTNSIPIPHSLILMAKSERLFTSCPHRHADDPLAPCVHPHHQFVSDPLRLACAMYVSYGTLLHNPEMASLYYEPTFHALADCVVDPSIAMNAITAFVQRLRESYNFETLIASSTRLQGVKAPEMRMSAPRPRHAP